MSSSQEQRRANPQDQGRGNPQTDQWVFRADGAKARGPITKSALLYFLNTRQLPMHTPVWHYLQPEYFRGSNTRWLFEWAEQWTTTTTACLPGITALPSCLPRHLYLPCMSSKLSHLQRMSCVLHIALQCAAYAGRGELFLRDIF